MYDGVTSVDLPSTDLIVQCPDFQRCSCHGNESNKNMACQHENEKTDTEYI